LKKAGEKYGYLTKVVKQYDVYGITREQLKRAVNKIEKNEVHKVSQHPAAVLLGGSISPMSTLTSERDLDKNPITTAALDNSMSTAATTTATTQPREKGGRPKGRTNKAKIRKAKKMQDILVETSYRLIESQKEANGRLHCNVWPSILRQMDIVHDLEANCLDKHIRMLKERVWRKNPTGLADSQTSPMAEIEPLLVDYVVKLSDIGMPLNKGGGHRTGKSMISGLPLEEKVIGWKQKHIRYKDNQSLLGDHWYNNFMDRNND
jgi:hypothetical protein